MGLIKTGIQAGAAVIIANKVAKAVDKHGQQKNTPPHPPCNWPHCPYSYANQQQQAYGHRDQGMPMPVGPPGGHGFRANDEQYGYLGAPGASGAPMPHAPYGDEKAPAYPGRPNSSYYAENKEKQ